MELLSSYARNQPASTAAAAAAAAQRLPSIARRLARHLQGAVGDLNRIAADPLAAPTPPEDPSDLLPPEECAFLRAGQRFQGRQVLMDSVWLSSKREQWDVTAAIHSFDAARGVMTGVLTVSRRLRSSSREGEHAAQVLNSCPAPRHPLCHAAGAKPPRRVEHPGDDPL